MIDEDEILPTEQSLAQPGAIDPNAGPTINPNAGPTINPNAGPTINPNAGPTIDPNAGAAINPDAEPSINPDAERQIDPDELQKVDDVRANVTALQQRIDRNFRELRSRRMAAFDNGEPFAANAYDGVAEDLSRLDGELSDLEAAYQGTGNEAQVATLQELRLRTGLAQQQLSAMRDARTPTSFQGAADTFGAQVGALSRGGATLRTPNTVAPSRGTDATTPGATSPAAGAAGPSAGTATPPTPTAPTTR